MFGICYEFMNGVPVRELCCYHQNRFSGVTAFNRIDIIILAKQICTEKYTSDVNLHAVIIIRCYL